MYRERLEAYIENHREEMLEDLKKLVSINSQRSEAKPGKPFGDGAADVLAAAEKMMAEYGLSTKNYENYVVTGDFNKEEKQLDILAHLDVVPVTDSWTVTKPFEPVIVDGKMYGRGTADDKGPAIAALYAMRAIKETGIELKKNVRLILGSDEECGSEDLEYYYGMEKEAPMTFTPDAEFPVINIEKGRLRAEFYGTFEEEASLPAIVEFHGGDKVNVVPANAWVIVSGIEKAIVEAAISENGSGNVLTVREQENGIKIAAKGEATHASTPEFGKNAISVLLALLEKLPLSECDQNKALLEIGKLFPVGDYTGKALGVAMEDKVSGHLSMNLGILHFDGKNLCGELDSRTPVCANDENVTAVVEKNLSRLGLKMEDSLICPVHHVPEESVLVQELLASYETYTGVKGTPLAIGGQTYVHELKNGVTFGCMVPEVDNHMHGDDEFMEIEVLIMSAKIFADAIIRLCGVK